MLGTRDRLRGIETTRRQFLTMTGAAAAVALTPELLGLRARPAGASRAQTRLPADPFTLGVAAGDPRPDGFVIWTRLAPEPLEPTGGMDDVPVAVRWQVAEDEGFRRVVRRGTVTTTAAEAHSVHVEVDRLRPWRPYFYRFAVGNDVSPVGRARTTPAPGARVPSLSLALASCQAWYQGFYTAYADMAAQGPDLVLHVGDYLYEYAVGATGGVRQTALPASFNREIMTLDDYRARHALYRSDPDLQAAHAAAAWAVSYDDHEVENNWAGPISENDDPPATFLERRAQAFRAWWEHMPVRAPQRPTGPDLQLYRRLTYGDLATINMLDTRQYRDDQAAGDGLKPPNPESLDPARTITGAEQERWLLDGFARSPGRWTVLAHQTAIAQLDHQAGEGQLLPMDTWDGYVGSRTRVLEGARDRRVRNLVSLIGDLHRTVASDLALDFTDPDAQVVGAEFGGTSIASGGDGQEIDQTGRTMLAENPHLKLVNRQRGWTRCTVTPSQWTTEFRVADYVSRPGSPMRTRATLVLEDGRPGIVEA